MSSPLPDNMRLRLEWDSDRDLSWLDVEQYRDDPVSIGGREISAEEYCDPNNHETYIAFLERTENDGETWEVVDCIGGVDLWAPTSRVTVGIYEEIPDDLEYLELWRPDAA